MRIAKLCLLILVISGVAGSSNAWAQHHGGHGRTYVGVSVGMPGYWPYYDPYPYYPYYPYYGYPYAYPPVVAVQPAPTVYIERGQEQPGTGQYWYYCHNPEGYYPYVKQCSTNWEKVTPSPQGK